MHSFLNYEFLVFSFVYLKTNLLDNFARLSIFYLRNFLLGVQGIQVLLNRLEAENSHAKNFKPEDVVDTSILEKLEQDGFTNQIQAQLGE